MKWLESAGARVVPIEYNWNASQLDTTLGALNGVLFTGGEESLLPTSPYYQTASHIWDKVLASNDKGVYFPLWGTCMGFQLISLLAAQNQTVLSHYAFDTSDVALPLELTPAAADSRMLGPDDGDDYARAMVDILSEQNVTQNFHHDGIDPAMFLGVNGNLTDFFNLLSTNEDSTGKAFASTIEAKDYPIYGVQWHPERPQFQWATSDRISHTIDAIRAMQYTANFFVHEATKNDHSFATQDAENDALIYNYQPVYQPGDDASSEQIYFFPPPQGA